MSLFILSGFGCFYMTHKKFRQSYTWFDIDVTFLVTYFISYIILIK